MGWIRKRLLGLFCGLAWLATPCLLWWGPTPVPRAIVLGGISVAGEPACFSADGRSLAMVKKHFKDHGAVIVRVPYEKPVDLPQTISVWDIDAGVTRFEEKEPNAGEIIFSPDLDQLLVIWLEGEVRLWNTKTSRVRSLQPMVLDGFWPHRWAFSPNGEILASLGMRHPAPKEPTDWYEIRLWDLADSKVVAKLPTPEPFPMPITFAPTGRQLAQATAGPPPQIRFFPWATKEPSRVVPVPLPLWTFEWAFAPDSNMLAAHLHDARAIVFFDGGSGQVLHFWDMGGTIGAWAFSPDSRLLAVNAVGIETRFRKFLKRVHSRIADVVAPPEDRTILLDIETGQRLAMLPSSSHLVFRPDGKTLVAYSKENDAVLLWDVPPRPRLPFFARLLPLGLAIPLSAVWWRRQREAGSRR